MEPVFCGGIVNTEKTDSDSKYFEPTTDVNLSLFHPTLPLVHSVFSYLPALRWKPQLWSFRGGCVRRTAGEDSWIMGLDFVTSYFHSFAPEERLSRAFQKSS